MVILNEYIINCYQSVGKPMYILSTFLVNFLKEVRLGSAVIKTFLGFLAEGDL